LVRCDATKRMKMSPGLLLGAILFAWAITPGRAQSAGPTVLEKGLYSYQAPVGWIVRKDNSASLGTAKDGLAPNIRVVIVSSPKPLADYVAGNLETFKAKASAHFQVMDQRPFATSAGLGIRVQVTEKGEKLKLQQIFYYFDGGSGKKLIVSGSCLAIDGLRETPLFDASVKTLSLE
jgi:hypothetical protein